MNDCLIISILNAQSPAGLLFFVVYFGLLLLLLSPVTPTLVVTYMQASNMPAIIISRVGGN